MDQTIFELQLHLVETTRAVIITPDGTRVTVRPPRGETTAMVKPQFPLTYTVKDLGISARSCMGLPGYTRPHQTTRIKYQGKYLPMHMPVTALCLGTLQCKIARDSCTFCTQKLRNKNGKAAPFRDCWFCLDSPAMHHGACCPHNPAAKEWNGTPHQVQHQMNWHRFIRTLPF